MTNLLVKRTKHKDTISLTLSQMEAICRGEITDIKVVDYNTGCVLTHRVCMDMVRSTMRQVGPSYGIAYFR